jgi:hydrocephalus-inducing protein
VTANFIDPLIEPSLPELRFLYMYDEKVPIGEQVQELTLKNVSPLALTLSLEATSPFSLDIRGMALEPQQSATVQVGFQPGFLGDRVSGTHEAPLLITYKEHPQQDKVKLHGELCFPNLTFDVAKVELGCVLNDQPRSQVVTITNPSRVEARYTWCFASQQDTPKLFDVLPIRGLLLPGESQRAEVLYKGGIDCKAKALALCEVAGGPEYELPMVAESSAIVHRLDKTLIDFGLLQYDRVEDAEMYVFNTGKVPVTFSVLLASLSRSNVLEVLPTRRAL